MLPHRNLVTMSNVSVVKGGRHLLDNVSIALNSGEVVGVIGRSGSGKSTLLRTLAKLETPIQGSVIYNQGVKLGFVTQSVDLISYYSIQKNLELALRCQRLVKNRREAQLVVKQWAERLSITHCLTKYPHEISGGEVQRASIARIVMLDPDIIVFDEVTSNLDPILAGEIGEMCISFANEGKCVVFASHQISLIDQKATRIFFIDDGTLTILDGKSSIFERIEPSSLCLFVEDIKKGW